MVGLGVVIVGRGGEIWYLAEIGGELSIKRRVGISSSKNIKLSKTQLPKIIKLGEFLGRPLEFLGMHLGTLGANFWDLC